MKINKKVFAGSDYGTASALNRRNFNNKKTTKQTNPLLGEYSFKRNGLTY